MGKDTELLLNPLMLLNTDTFLLHFKKRHFVVSFLILTFVMFLHCAATWVDQMHQQMYSPDMSRVMAMTQ